MQVVREGVTKVAEPERSESPGGFAELGARPPLGLVPLARGLQGPHVRGPRGPLPLPALLGAPLQVGALRLLGPSPLRQERFLRFGERVLERRVVRPGSSAGREATDAPLHAEQGREVSAETLPGVPDGLLRAVSEAGNKSRTMASRSCRRLRITRPLRHRQPASPYRPASANLHVRFSTSFQCRGASTGRGGAIWASGGEVGGVGGSDALAGELGGEGATGVDGEGGGGDGQGSTSRTMRSTVTGSGIWPAGAGAAWALSPGPVRVRTMDRTGTWTRRTDRTRADTRRASIVGMWVLEVNESRDASKRERSSDDASRTAH